MRIATIFLAIFYSLWETAYFGWNMTPHSDAEILADGISCVIFALAWMKP